MQPTWVQLPAPHTILCALSGVIPEHSQKGFLSTAIVTPKAKQKILWLNTGSWGKKSWLHLFISYAVFQL